MKYGKSTPIRFQSLPLAGGGKEANAQTIQLPPAETHAAPPARLALPWKPPVPALTWRPSDTQESTGGHMRSAMKNWILAAATIALASMGAVVGTSAQQQAPQRAASPTQPAEPAKDYNQRALEIYEFRKAAQSGPARGQEIYYYKCWICHNELAEGGAPKLAGLFKRPTLVTGAPVNDETVKKQIRDGSANMGSYKSVLSEADLNDLVSWLHDEQCCWNADALPRNPRYKGAAAAPAQALYASLTGGPKGLVKNARGEPIEGIMVQLISDTSAIRTTVYSHADGRYEFPQVASGSYTLHIARPREFYPWSKEKLEIKGADALED